MAAEILLSPRELKVVDGAMPGSFVGYGAVFNNEDSHGDVILPGAFADTLRAHRASGSLPGMYAEHSAFRDGDPLPIGVWTEMEEDSHGLRVSGRIAALDSETGKRMYGLLRDKAMTGLSIAFTLPPDGATPGRGAGQPKRWLKRLNLKAVDVVRAPSNPRARVHSVKHADDGLAELRAVLDDINAYHDRMMLRRGLEEFATTVGHINRRLA